jgi:hypothetical protein
MYQSQHAALANALQSAGLPQQSAIEIARILSNPQQTYRSGPIVQDTTPRNMRQVTPDDALTLPNLEFRESDPYREKRELEESEERPEPEQEGTLQENQAPQQVAFAVGVDGGAFTEAVSKGDHAAINLRMRGFNNGIPVVNAPDNSLFAKTFRAESDASGLRFFVQQTNQELIWKLTFGKEAALFVDVVTDVTLDANGINVSKARIYPLAAEPLPGSVIPVVACP